MCVGFVMDGKRYILRLMLRKIRIRVRVIVVK